MGATVLAFANIKTKRRKYVAGLFNSIKNVDPLINPRFQRHVGGEERKGLFRVVPGKWPQCKETEVRGLEICVQCVA